MAWMIYFLITHPDAEKKLRKEFDAVLEDRPIAAEDIKDLT